MALFPTQVDDDLLQGFVLVIDIQALAQPRGHRERFMPIAGIEAPGDQISLFVIVANGHDVHDRQAAREVLRQVVENIPDRRLDAALDLLPAVDRREEMGLVDRLDAAQPDEQVLAVVGDAANLMGQELADGDDPVPLRFEEDLVDLPADGRTQLAFGELPDKIRRDVPEMRQRAPPIVFPESVPRDPGEHRRGLLFGHGTMGAEGRHDRNGRFRDELSIKQAGDLARARRVARKIRR